MARGENISPIGSTAREAASRRASRSEEYRRQRDKHEPFRELAWLLIHFRMERQLTQEQLAELVGTSHSQISRLESGRHRPSFETMERIAHALDQKLVIGFESEKDGQKELVSL